MFQSDPRRQVTRQSYSQFLLSSQINYTMTYFAQHQGQISHDAVRRYLLREQLSGTMVWEQVKAVMTASPQGYLIFDDVVLNKQHSYQIELARRQYSGKEKAVILGIGIVTCVYVNPESEEYWLVDYRIWDPDTDGLSKLDHAHAMFENALARGLLFRRVMFDAWYAEMELLKRIERAGKTFVCAVKGNRLVCDQRTHIPGQTAYYERIEQLYWHPDDDRRGKLVQLKDMPQGFTVKLIRLVLTHGGTDYLISNEVTSPSASVVQQAYHGRWMVEQVHRETQQLTGIQKCQARKNRIQRNHIACALLVWVRLTTLARCAQRTIYNLKQGLLHDYMRQQLAQPSLQMHLF